MLYGNTYNYGCVFLLFIVNFSVPVCTNDAHAQSRATHDIKM
jgi:hypothetical protein